METQIVILLFVIVGGLANTFIQYLAAIKNSSVPITFDLKYFASLGISMVTVVFAALGVFLAIPIPTDTPILYAIVSALMAGYAINNVANLTLDTATNKN